MAARTIRSATEPSHQRPGPRRPCVPTTIRSAVVAASRIASTGGSSTTIASTRYAEALSGELGQVVGGGRLCRAPLGFQPRDLFEGEVRRRLEPLGMQRAEPCVEGRRHHSADGQRAGRRVAEVHAHEHRLRRALPEDHWYGAHDATSIGAATVAGSVRSWRFAM